MIFLFINTHDALNITDHPSSILPVYVAYCMKLVYDCSPHRFLRRSVVEHLTSVC